MRRIALWGAAALAALGLAAGSAARATATVGPPPVNDQLAGVACPTTGSCLAVGINFIAPSPVAETWGKLGWRTIAVKLPAGFSRGGLDAVSCPATTRCFAVGNVNAKSGPSYALADLWNGKTWTPAKASRSPGTLLRAVSCPSARFCLAGGVFGAADGTGHVIADTWNGTRWAQLKVPAPARAMASEFDAVSCATASFCIAAGSATSPQGDDTALLAEWNGRTWSYLKSAAAPGLSQVDLTGVSCPSAKSCVAVGNGALAKGGTGTLIQVWNGNSWARASAVAWPKGSTNSWLIGMSCYAAGHCLSAGFIDWNPNSSIGDTTGRAAAALWNGKRWASTPITAPGPGRSSILNAVTCKSATFCVAVGMAGPFGAPHGTGLSAFWNGKSWKLVAAR